MDITTFRAEIAAEREARQNAQPPEACAIADSASSDEMIACGCGDCMDRALGRELEMHPIAALRVIRRG